MKAPMEVPPTMSMGIPDSSIALITPMWEQPLDGQTDGANQEGDGRGPPPPHHSAGTHLAPPPPRTRAMVLPVRTRARREKSLCRSALFSKTFSYTSRCGRVGQTGAGDDDGGGPPGSPSGDSLTSLVELRREKTRRGHLMWR